MKIRVQIAMHFEWDPALQVAAIPEEIICTTAIGDKITPVKMPSSNLGPKKREELLAAMQEMSIAANKKASKAPVKKAEPKPAEKAGEEGSLF